ncbi:uncharacterized protein METZ01_LOCUS431035, partial [marine metagenome]
RHIQQTGYISRNLLMFAAGIFPLILLTGGIDLIESSF